MSITNVKKRIAVFYDDKGEQIAKKSFSHTAETLEYAERSYNVSHDEATFTKVKRWYWDLEIYHYNINNPNPMILNKKCEPLISAEMYNIQLNTKVARDLNNLHNKGLLANLDFKTVLIIIGIGLLAYLLLTKQIKL